MRPLVRMWRSILALAQEILSLVAGSWKRRFLKEKVLSLATVLISLRQRKESRSKLSGMILKAEGAFRDK